MYVTFLFTSWTKFHSRRRLGLILGLADPVDKGGASPPVTVRDATFTRLLRVLHTARLIDQESLNVSFPPASCHFINTDIDAAGMHVLLGQGLFRLTGRGLLSPVFK